MPSVDLIHVIIACLCLSAAAVSLRSASRIINYKWLYGSDWFVILAFLTAGVQAACEAVAVKHGYGKRSVAVLPEDLRLVSKCLFVGQIAYKLSTTCSKVSVLLLYGMIFNTRYRRIIKFSNRIAMLWGAVSIMLNLCQCLPITRNWDPTVDGSCINIPQFWYSYFIYNLISDIWIVILGFSLSYADTSLNISRRHRFFLSLIFCVGCFTCATTAMNIYYIPSILHVHDFNYESFNLTIWSTIEVNTAIVCTCLPMLKQPLEWTYKTTFPILNRIWNFFLTYILAPTITYSSCFWGARQTVWTDEEWEEHRRSMLARARRYTLPPPPPRVSFLDESWDNYPLLPLREGGREPGTQEGGAVTSSSVTVAESEIGVAR